MIQIYNFLDRATHSNLLDYAIAHQANFVPTTTSTGEVDYRKSLILYSFPEFETRIVEKIRECLPKVQEQLNLRFDVKQVECQLTSHGDGNYYKIHNDDGHPDVANRMLTYVYYFYREPKAFSGGELVIYGEEECAIEPVNNSIVFFPSHLLHEVKTINLPSLQFADGRFTVNGWLRC